MGCCLSKTNQSCPSSSPVKPPNLPTQLKTELKKLEEDEQREKLGLRDKELVGTHDRKIPDLIGASSSDSDGLTRLITNNTESLVKEGALAGNGAVVRISNCSKEEVDAILIQCGRLSRTSSANRGGSAGRRYSGSKRSHDFDRESNASIAELNCDDDDDERQSSGSHRRRTPSLSRVNRSPGRRSQSPITQSSNGGNVKRVLVKRNLGEGLAASRAVAPAASPRSRSPAMSSGVNGVNTSRKAECTPHRRTPLTGIDINSLPFNPLASKFGSLQDLQRSKEIDEQVVLKHPVSVVSKNNQLDVDASNAEGFVSEMSAEQLKEEGDNREQLELPPTSTRSRSSTRSRDLDVRVEALLDPKPASSYNSLILQDIRNFHRKTSSNKYCSIVESVPDLNSCNRPNPPCTSKDLNIESEVNAGDDLILMEPSLHKYITVRKRGAGLSESSHGGDFDELESSGTNSFVAGSQNQGLSSSSWEPNLADSSECWTSSRSREDGLLPVSFQRLAASEAACGAL